MATLDFYSTDKTGLLANLATDEKGTLVGAINENTEALETKAEIDGYYDEMAVGSAEQLISTVLTEEKEPYLFRTSGGSMDIGNREVDTIVGGSIAWNQIKDFPATSNAAGLTVTVGTDYITANGTATTGQAQLQQSVCDFVSGHKYLIYNPQNFFGGGDGAFISLYPSSGGPNGTFYNKQNVIFSSGSTGKSYLRIVVASGATLNNVKVRMQLFDLTQMFGTAVADAVYAMEQSTAGSGVAWFKRMFPKAYYEYNAGELLSIEGLQSHDTVGFNAYNPETGTAEVLGGQQYQITGTYTAISLDGTTITPNSSGIFTPSANGTLTVTGGNATNTCVHLVWSGYRNGEYEAYKKHTYPLDSSLTLRGIPKWANGSMYYDGDTYESDGTVTRKYGIVDLGTLNWVYLNDGIFRVSTSETPNLKTAYEPLWIVPGYTIGTATDYNGWKARNKQIGLLEGARNFIICMDTTYTTAAAFKTAMSGVYLVYELATPTTETAEAFQNPQIVDDFGTEEYVTDSIVPVGHVTEYMANLRDKLQHLPDLAAEDGVYAISQSNLQMTLVNIPTAVSELPEAPTADGTYTLKVTVSGGTATYTWEA